MADKKILICAAAAVSFYSFSLTSLFAETVYLKSGKKFEGKIIEKTDKDVKVNFYGVPLTYHLNEIERIEEGNAPVSEGQNIIADMAQKYGQGTISDREDVNKYIEEAGQFVKTYRLDKAIESLKKAAALDSGNSRIHVLMGSIYFKMGQIDNSIDSLKTAIELAPDNYEAYAGLSAAYTLVGKKQETIDSYLKFIKYCPDLSMKAQTYVVLSELYKQNGEDEKSRDALEQSTKIYREQKDEKSVRRVEEMRDKYAEDNEAILKQTKAIDANPKDAYAYVSRGFIYYSQGKVDSAISDYDKAIDINPRYDEAYYYRAAAEEDQDKLDLAIADYTKAIEINPTGKKSYYALRGVVYGKKGDFNKAFGDFDTAIKNNPNDDGAYYNRGYAYSMTGKFDLAIKDYDAAILINPERFDAVQNRAMSNFYLKNYDKTWEDVHRLERNGIYLDANFMKTLKTTSGRDK